MSIYRFLTEHKGEFFLFFVVVVGVISAPFHLSQVAYAVYVIAAFLLLSIIDVGLSFLVLLFLTQFFIGDFYRPYLFLINILCLVFGIVWFATTMRKRESVKFPFWWIVVPYILVAVLAFPLNLKEVFLDIKVWGWIPFLKSVAVAGTLSHAYWLRELPWEFISFLVLIGVFNLLVKHPDLEKRAWCVIAASLILAAIMGIALLYNWIPYEGRFLSINFADSAHNPGMLTSYGWSVTFFVEYFAATFPFLFIALFFVQSKWKKIGILICVLITVFAVMKTYRRATFVVVFYEILTGVAFYFVITHSKKLLQFAQGKKTKFALIVLGVFLIGCAISAVFIRVLGDMDKNVRFSVESKFSYQRLRKDPRIATHELSFHMAVYEPLLGLGSGGYSQQFDRLGGRIFLKRYEKYLGFDRWLNDYQGSPHSTYLKMLVERGFLGLIAFLWLAGGLLWVGFRAFKFEGLSDRKWFLAALLTSLSGMLLYAFFMDIFWVPGVRVLFWMVLGIIAAMSYPVIPKIPFTKKKALAVALTFFTLLGYRVWRVKAEPISDRYEAGFYRWEVPRKGKDRKPYRLTSGHALKILIVKGDVIRFRVCSNKPDVDKNPQILSVYLNGRQVKKIALRDKGWKEVVIPTAQLKGQKVFMDLRVDGVWIPYKYGRGRSKRELGVIIGKIRQE